MTMEKLSNVLKYITNHNDIVGFISAEYLPFDKYKLFKMFESINTFND